MPDSETMVDNRARRWSIGVLGIALLLAALLLLVSMFLFDSRKPVIWPPLSQRVYTAIYVVAGTVLLGVLYLAIYILILLVSAIARKGLWRDLLARLLSAAIAVTIVFATGSACMKAFYWPWAVASALKTIDSRPPRWRLKLCAEVLASQWDENIAHRMLRGMKEDSAAGQAARSYVLAASGQKKALQHLAEIAMTFPADNSVTGSVDAETGIAGRGDVKWLMDSLGDFHGLTLEEIARILADEPRRVEWDRKAGRYVLKF